MHKLETKLADFFEPRLEPVTVLPCPFENPNIRLNLAHAQSF